MINQYVSKSPVSEADVFHDVMGFDLTLSLLSNLALRTSFTRLTLLAPLLYHDLQSGVSCPEPGEMLTWLFAELTPPVRSHSSKPRNGRLKK